MKTVVYKPSPENIRLLADLLRRGETVAFPTETVYGLGADALNESAVAKIYAAKGRPGDNPLIVHLYDPAQLKDVALSVPPMAYELMSAFTPGPLTLIFRKKPEIPDCVTGGLDTVGVRFPAHTAAIRLLRETDRPVCAPSANLSTRPSPTTAQHVLADLDGRIPAILDGGPCEVGLESTIVDVSGDRPRLLRKGGIPAEALLPYTGPLETVETADKPLCPGMKYKHYAPEAEVFFSAYYDGMSDTIAAKYDELVSAGKRAVILCLDGNAAKYGDRALYRMGPDFTTYARNAFAALRRADAEKYDAVIAEGVHSAGIGGALINRLIKSSGGKVI